MKLRERSDGKGAGAMTRLRRLFRERDGSTGIEYAIIGSLLSIAIVGGASLVGNELTNVYQDVAGKVGAAINGDGGGDGGGAD